MPLSDADKQQAKDAAQSLKEGDWDTYKLIRTNLQGFIKEVDETEVVMALLFNLLPPTAQDNISTQLMMEAMDHHAKSM